MNINLSWAGVLFATVVAGCGDENTGTPATLAEPEFMDVSAASADLNGDGITDLAVLTAPTDPESTRPAFVSVHYGPLSRGPLPPASEHYDTASTASAITLADVNGDGVQDLVIAQRKKGGNPIRYMGRVHIVYRALPGPLRGEADQMLGLDACSVALADVDGDGLQDLLATNSSLLYVARGLGAGSFETPVNFACSGVWTVRRSLSQGGADLVVARWLNPNVADIIRWNGHDAPAVISTMVFSKTVSSMASADLNGDRSEDLLVGTSDGSSGALHVVQIGERATVKSAVATELGTVLRITSGDFNGDGILDVGVGGLSSDGSIACLPGAGSGRFETAGALIPAAPGSFLDSADLDGDGKADLILRDASGCARISCGVQQ